MKTRRSAERRGISPLALLLGVAAGWASSTAGHASPPDTQSSGSIPCATVENLEGRVQILDSSRAFLIDATPKASVPCDGWVSTGPGWVQLRHRDGYVLHVGGESFLEIAEGNRDGKNSGDQVILYRGQVFASAPDGAEELRINTANARARLSSASAVVLFNQQTQESQLIVLERVATLENRFEASRRVKVGAGEASDLNLALLRVIPSAPRAVATASLRAKLEDLKVGTQAHDRALGFAKRRQERKFASWAPPKTADGAETAGGRKPAGLEFDRTAARYLRHKEDPADADQRDQWVKRHVGDAPDSEKLLFPEAQSGRPQRVSLEIVDRGPLSNPQQKAEAEEKRKLIEELARVRED